MGKWPFHAEVRLLVEMADLFGTSVDALLDYKVRSRDCAHIAECLKAALVRIQRQIP